MEKFELNDMVRWKSQARGSVTEKVGRIVRILKKYEVPVRVHRKEFSGHRRMFDGTRIPGSASCDVGYFVEVIKSPHAMPLLYLPRPERLKRAKIKKEE